MSIEIRINNQTIALPKGAKLNREMETTIFNKENTAYDFSYPIDIPLTESTKIALGHPNLLAIEGRQSKYSGEIIIDGIFVSSADIVVLQVNLQTNMCRISILGQYAALADVFGDAKVCDLEMGGFDVLTRSELYFEELDFVMPQNVRDGAYEFGEIRIKYRGSNLNAYMTAVAKGVIETDYLFPKAIDIKGDSPGNSEGIDIINAYDHYRDRYVEADLYNFMNSEWQWIPDTTPMNEYEIQQRHWWVPMYKLTKVLSHCFTEYGLGVEGDLLTDAKLQKVVLYNTHAINMGFVGEWEHTYPDNYLQITAGFPNGYLFPRNHLPQMKIVDFLIELGKRYNWQFQYHPFEKKVKIIANKSPDGIDNIIDLTHCVNPKGTINYEKSDAFLNGYKFSFAADSADSAISTDVQDDVNTYSSRGTITDISNLGSISSPLADEVVFVRNTNTWYKYDSVEGWLLYSHNIGAYNTTGESSAQEVSTQIVSCPMTLPEIQMIPINIYLGGPEFGDSYINSWECVPFSQIGMTFDQYNYIDWESLSGPEYPIGTGVGHPWISHFHSARKSPIAHLPHLVSCLGFRTGITGSDREYYMATTGHYNNRGVLENTYSGSWLIPDGIGLYKDWWQWFAEEVHNSIVVEMQAVFSADMYHNFDPNSFLIIVEGLKYYCKKANIVMPFPEIATLQLVKLKN